MPMLWCRSLLHYIGHNKLLLNERIFDYTNVVACIEIIWIHRQCKIRLPVPMSACENFLHIKDGWLWPHNCSEACTKILPASALPMHGADTDVLKFLAL